MLFVVYFPASVLTFSLLHITFSCLPFLSDPLRFSSCLIRIATFRACIASKQYNKQLPLTLPLCYLIPLPTTMRTNILFHTAALFFVLLTFISPPSAHASGAYPPTTYAVASKVQQPVLPFKVKKNATMQELSLELETDDATNATVYVANIIGKTLVSQRVELNGGSEPMRISININALPSGTYIVYVAGSSWTTQARKFVKNNP